MSQPRRFDPLPLGEDGGLPYSKGLMSRALIATGVSAVRAYELALRVEGDLRARSERVVEMERLGELAIEVLGADDGEQTMRRLRRFAELHRLDVPIVVLVGGATGTGKSTVATEVAHRLGITRVTSTDFVRQTMRAFFSEEFMPSIHYSSFEAGDALPAVEREAGDPLLVGFLDQTRQVLVGVNASIDRALGEGWSMVLEGVHLVPGMIAMREGAIVVHVIVAVPDEGEHEQHFWSRHELSAGERARDKYLGRFAEIRRLQDFIVREAGKEGVPVIENDHVEQAIAAVIELVFDRAAVVEQLA